MMGLVVVARLAARHGVKVELRPARERGTVADVMCRSGVLVPRALAGRSQAPAGFPAAIRPPGIPGAPAGQTPAGATPRPNFPPPLALESTAASTVGRAAFGPADWRSGGVARLGVGRGPGRRDAPIDQPGPARVVRSAVGVPVRWTAGRSGTGCRGARRVCPERLPARRLRPRRWRRRQLRRLGRPRQHRRWFQPRWAWRRAGRRLGRLGFQQLGPVVRVATATAMGPTAATCRRGAI